MSQAKVSAPQIDVAGIAAYFAGNPTAGIVSSVGISGSTGLTVSGSPITSSGTLTLTLNAELQGLAGLSTTGLVSRTGTGTYSVSSTLPISSVSGLSTSNIQINSLGVGVAAPGSAGTINAIGNITAFFSDMRLKDVVSPINNALEKVNTLNGFIFKPNSVAQKFGYDGNKLEVGLSAQEVQKILPEIIESAPISAEYMTFDYAKLVPLLIEAIKQLANKVDKLESLM